MVTIQTEKYADRSRYYLKNASRFIDAGDTEKASEFLWGSMAQAVKALASSKGIQLKTHNQIRKYINSATRELGDKSIYDTFIKANFLHGNFYESELDMEDIRLMGDDIREGVEKLLDLLSGIEKEKESKQA